MLLYITLSLFVAAYFYLLFSGLRVHKKLEQLQKNIDTNRRQSTVQRLESAFTNKLHCSLEGAEKRYQRNILTGSGSLLPLHLAGPTEPVKNELIDFLYNFLRQHNDSLDANIKLDVVSGSCPVTYRDSLAVLRIIVQLAENAKEHKIGSTSVFMLLIAPLQIAVETIKSANYDACPLRPIIEPEILRSYSLHIIHHETNSTFERLIIGAVEDNEDHSSRRPRNFQRKH